MTQKQKEKITERIKKQRIRLGWSQGDAATEAGMDRGNWANVERGARVASVETLQQMAEAVGLKLTVKQTVSLQRA